LRRQTSRKPRRYWQSSGDKTGVPNTLLQQNAQLCLNIQTLLDLSRVALWQVGWPCDAVATPPCTVASQPSLRHCSATTSGSTVTTCAVAGGCASGVPGPG
jgi:hypothetical protein